MSRTSSGCQFLPPMTPFHYPWANFPIANNACTRENGVQSGWDQLRRGPFSSRAPWQPHGLPLWYVIVDWFEWMSQYYPVEYGSTIPHQYHIHHNVFAPAVDIVWSSWFTVLGQMASGTFLIITMNQDDMNVMSTSYMKMPRMEGTDSSPRNECLPSGRSCTI